MSSFIDIKFIHYIDVQNVNNLQVNRIRLRYILSIQTYSKSCQDVCIHNLLDKGS